MRNTRRAYLPALALMAVVGLALALCLMPAGALADSATTDNASSGTTSSTTETGAPNAAGTTLTTGEASGAAGSDSGTSESGASSTSEDTSTTTTTLLSNGMASSSETSGAQGLLAALQADEATAVAVASGDTTVTEKIYYDTNTGIHSVYSTPNDTSSTRIILYCMNNKAHWPHATKEIPTVPDYTQGYLTEASFNSKEEYEACMHKLEALLYAGYNYNGLNLYKVVSGTPRATLQEFNDALQAPDNLRSDYPNILGDTVFTYESSKDSSSENYQKLVEFMQQVFSLYFRGGTTASGLTYNDIIAAKFYKAVYALINSDAALMAGVGHVEGTSLPVGGESTHCVITAHSGMRNLRMFDDIRQLEPGDLVLLHTMGDVYAYRVVSSEVVWPDETSSLAIAPGEDLLTLVTCTPYGVNDHRLLVHCERTDYVPEEANEQAAVTERHWGAREWAVVVVAVALAGVAVDVVVHRVHRRRQRG